jgi:hypothetical protein
LEWGLILVVKIKDKIFVEIVGNCSSIKRREIKVTNITVSASFQSLIRKVGTRIEKKTLRTNELKIKKLKLLINGE